jgi:hypothetical protein
MKLKQISVPIENSSNRLYEFARALDEKGISPRALTVVDTGNFGELRVLVSDTTTARQILMQKSIPARIDDVVAVQMDDTPGQLPDLLARLMDAGINIRYSYALAEKNSEKAVMIFCFSDNDKAIRMLGDREVRILDDETLGRMEAATYG